MSIRIIRLCFAAWCVATLAIVGCNESRYELAPVCGTVMIDGRPLSHARVMFAPLEVGDSLNPGKPAFGVLQEDGSFVLTTYKEHDGAVVGEHWVTIISLAKKQDGATPAGRFSRLTVPQRVRVIADKENRIDLKLTAQDVARYGVLVGD